MRAGRSTARATLWIGLLVAPVAHGGDEFIGVRNYGPFAQVYGLPGFADATVLNAHQTSLTISTTVINHSDVGIAAGETINLDGETYITDLVLGRGVTERLSVAVTLPWVAYNGGIFDGAIETWHDIWGLPNGFRDGPDNELLIGYARNGMNEFLLDSSGSGIGDVRLEAKYRLAGSSDADFGMVLRGGVKLPTGDAVKLRGSEATDFSIDLALRTELALPRGELVLLAHGGLLLLGAGEVLPQLQHDTVGFAGAGTVWRLNDRWRFNLQLYGQSSYFDSELHELDADSLSIAVGGSYTWVKSRTRLAVAIVEDPVNDMTPDVALQIELTKGFE